jgi:TPR repeat protein
MKMGLVFKKINENPLNFLRDAGLGNPQAMFSLSVCYDKSLGVPKDLTVVIQYLTNASERDEPRALCNSGLIYEKGENISQDIPKSIDFYERAAHLGQVQAMINLALLYEKERN